MGGDPEIAFVLCQVFKELIAGSVFIVHYPGNDGFYMAILELYKVVIAIQSGIEGVSWLNVWYNPGTAIIMVRW